jgi:hypothetical protein
VAESNATMLYVWASLRKWDGAVVGCWEERREA